MGFFDRITSYFRSDPEFDLASLGDELAYRIDWTPLVGGGANFTTHRLVKSPGLSRNQVEVKTTLWAYIFGGFFILFAFLMFLSALGDEVTWEVNGVEGPLPSWWPLVPLVFSLIGCAIIWRFKTKEGKFDYGTYLFTRGSKCFRLDEVRAIQLISERVTTTKGGSYRSFELNLVFNSGDRVNIVDHGSLIALRQDARMLSEFLRVPIWDVIGSRIGSVIAHSKLSILDQNLSSF